MSKFNLKKIKNLILSRKKTFFSILIVLAVIVFFVFRGSDAGKVNIDTVKRVDLVRSVRATGQVVSDTNLDLSFSKAGIVKSVRVSVGDKVKSGQILAALDQGQALATLTEKKGALLGAEARYNKVLQGASNEEITLSEVALKNAQTDLANTKNAQAGLVSSARQAFLNSSIAAFPTSLSDTQTAPTITGTYVLDKEGDIKINVSQSGSFNTSGLFNYVVMISTTTPQPIGDSGLYIQFPASFTNQGEWIISIPNKKASDYLTNYNSYKNALENETSAIASAQAIVDQKQAELNLKKAAARSPDLDIAQAEVLSAKGALQSASSSYEDTIIRAPVSGTITKVDIKYGELSTVGKTVITLEDVDNLYIEALINEANIAYLKTGQSVGITFDAFGSEKKFTGTIVQIDPSAESSEGVVNYKIKVSLSVKDSTIRPGMNANIDVLAGEALNVLAIPSVAIIKENEKSFVNVVIDEKKKKYEKRQIVTGFVGDNNLTEIISGLLADQKITLKVD